MKLQQDKRITFPERLQSVGVAPSSRLEQKCIEAFLNLLPAGGLSGSQRCGTGTLNPAPASRIHGKIPGEPAVGAENGGLSAV